MMKNILLLTCLVSQFFLAQEYTSEEIKIINKGDINAALPIFQTTNEHQHSVLLKTSQEVIPTDINTKILINRMKQSLLLTDGGVGIAAPQVGINRNIIWVQRFDKVGEPLEYFINPKILWRSEIQNLGPEGDLSIPYFNGLIYRSKVIQLEFYDWDGQKHSEMVEGFTAVIFQHEIDHLSGILISDKIKQDENKNYMKVDAYQISP